MANSKELLENIIREVIEFTFSKKIEVEVTDTRVYLSPKDISILFGADCKLECLTEKKVNIFSKNSKLASVPVSAGTDVTKIYITNSAKNILGIEAPISCSTDKENIDNEVRVVGTNGEISVKNGTLIRERFIILPNKVAEYIDLKNNDIVSVKTQGVRSLIFENVRVLVKDEEKKFYIDCDEANAALLKDGSIVEIIKNEEKLKTNKNLDKKDGYKLEKDGIYTKIVDVL